MTESRVWTFFYGSFMDLDVLGKLGLVPDEFEVAVLNGFDICIQPLANLAVSDDHCVYGIVAPATHSELARLYEYASDTLGGVYLARAVLVQSRSERWLPALCYIASDLKRRSATAEYVDLIIQAAKAHGFPRWYIDRLAGFRECRA